MEIQLWLLHLDRSNGSFISGHQVSVGDLKEQCFSRAVSHRHLEMVQQSFNKRCFFCHLKWRNKHAKPTLNLLATGSQESFASIFLPP